MSKHVGRNARWARVGPGEYRSGAAVVRAFKGAWWAWVSYQLREGAAPGEFPPPFEDRCDRLGPFRRPRNAMMAAEEHAVLLRRRHGEDVRVDVPVRGE
jgi:hypothetical protein